MIALENMSDKGLKRLQEEFEKLRARAAPEKVITAPDKARNLLPETVQ